MKTHILLLETATKVCSVAVGSDHGIVAFRESSSDKYIHAEKLNVFIQESMDEADITMGDLDAVCVSMGPGSYTGLRIGVSAAKGICSALDIPLLAIPTLQSIAAGHFSTNDQPGLCCPMIDARRMEVYTALFTRDLSEYMPTHALVIEGDPFEEHLTGSPIWFVGDGAEKCASVFKHRNARFSHPLQASARWMVDLALQHYKAGKFEDLAYFVPFYLKAYQAGKAKEGPK